jgi:hypothetical protein
MTAAEKEYVFLLTTYAAVFALGVWVGVVAV